jgi:dihydrofolate synthase/folylpolyglutamate synthase
MGVLADKDYDAILRHTSPFAKQIITITPNNTRGLSSAKLAEVALAYCNNVIDAGTISKAIATANAAADENDVIIAFGSLSYLNEVYEELGLFLLIQQ